mmetsp:Transcript_97788/g.168592  ORF Transcript_97788/g.168592 Transcript_97788/m.168592 type:complete len:84 (+) Transcript_97788:216-467(+)
MWRMPTEITKEIVLSARASSLPFKQRVGGLTLMALGHFRGNCYPSVTDGVVAPSLSCFFCGVCICQGIVPSLGTIHTEVTSPE